MKSIVLGFLLVVVVAAVSVHAIDQSRILGAIRFGDRLLDRDYALKVKRNNVVQVHNFKYPKFGTGSVISCVKVLDKWFNGTNGDLYLNGGGVGSRTISLSIRSKLGHGLQYDIEVWGR